jgi:hypothetical protein
MLAGKHGIASTNPNGKNSKFSVIFPVLRENAGLDRVRKWATACQAGRIGVTASLTARQDNRGLGAPFCATCSCPAPPQGDPECKYETPVLYNSLFSSLFSGKSAPCPLREWSGIICILNASVTARQQCVQAQCMTTGVAGTGPAMTAPGNASMRLVARVSHSERIGGLVGATLRSPLHYDAPTPTDWLKQSTGFAAARDARRTA